jgi:predicted metal-dependent hydrolase
MSIDAHVIVVGGVRVQVVRKDIKNLHVGVYPPRGRVRVAAPLTVSNAAVRLAVVGKLAWIKRQRARFEAQPRQSQREMVSGESHYFLGRRYRLRILPRAGGTSVVVRNRSTLELHVSPTSTTAQREQVLLRWYRQRLKELVSPLLDHWEPILGVHAAAWGVRKMKTRWGTCNPVARRISFNLELIKKPPQCLEYLVVHELAHLIEPSHNEDFVAVMDRSFPLWRLHRDALNSEPLAHDTWDY